MGDNIEGISRGWNWLAVFAGIFVILLGVVITGCREEPAENKGLASQGVASFSTTTVIAVAPQNSSFTATPVPPRTSVPTATAVAPRNPTPTATKTILPTAIATVHSAPGGSDASLFVDNWRVYSSRLYYDMGGGGSLGGTSSRYLELFANGKWQYGSSAGTWSLSAITGSDWKRWGVEAYGPTRKIVLSGWSEGAADGPVEESQGHVDFIWVIYRAVPPTVQAPGSVWLKFGHS